MKKIVICIFMLAMSFNLRAQQPSHTEVVAIATTTMRSLGKNVYPTDVDSIYKIQKNSNTLLQEVVFSSGESVLLTGHKSCMPVIGYSLPEESCHSTPILKKYADLPDVIKDVVEYYSIQVEYCYNSNDDSPYNSRWITMQNNEQIRDANIIIVDPLLTSKWGQDTSNCGEDPQAYNYYVAESNGSCTHCFAGCGPVAMAQIMYFWKYPVLSHIFEDSFDWCNMPNYLSTLSDNYEKERNAVARLIRQCGLAANAMYCIRDCETGSNLDELAWALEDLGYESDYQIRNDYSTSDWIEMIKNELDNNRPILYSGYGRGAHAFVCDGYSSDNYFHFNWGWNGKHNDLWLTLNNISPGNHNFTEGQKAIFKIEPITNQNYCDFSYPLDTFYTIVTITFGNSVPLYSVTPTMMTVLTSAPTTSPASYRTIPSGATAEYVAHKEVVLQPGFTAEYGSNFTARIEPCTNCEDRNSADDMTVPDAVTDSIDNRMLIQNPVIDSIDAIPVPPTDFLVRPNPTRERLTVRDIGDLKAIDIYDMGGRRMFRWFIVSKAEGELVLDVSKLSSGLYYLSIETVKGKKLAGQFIKE